VALSYLKDKIILVTGACGTIGSELINQLLNVYKVGELVGLDNNESDLFFMEQRYKNYPNANFFLTDVRDKDALSRKCLGIDILFHAAAYKHVVLCEKSPFEAVQTNILGVKNIIDAASECKVKKVIFTSSDKAVNPTNVMGTSKTDGRKAYHCGKQFNSKRACIRVNPLWKCFGFKRFCYPHLPGTD